MEETGIAFVLLIYFVSLAVSIMFMVKIWNMCNDVKDIRNMMAKHMLTNSIYVDNNAEAAMIDAPKKKSNSDNTGLIIFVAVIVISIVYFTLFSASL